MNEKSQQILTNKYNDPNTQIPANKSDELNLRPKQNGTLRATQVSKLPSKPQTISLNQDVKRGKGGEGEGKESENSFRTSLE